VHPEPLRRIPTDGVFQHGGKAGRVVDGVGLRVASGGEGDLGVEVEDVAAFRFFPKEKAGKDGGSGLEGDAGEAGRGAGLDAEEGNEAALRRRHVGVHEDADRLPMAHGGDEATGKIVFVEDAVAVTAADLVDHAVNQGIVEAADDHAHGIAGEGVVEAGELPGSHVAGKDEDSFAAIAGAQVMVEAFVANEAGGEVRGVVGHLAELGEEPAQVAVFQSKDVFALRGGEAGKGEFEVTQTDSAKTTEQAERDGGDESPGGAGDPAGEDAESVDADPGDGKFELVAGCGLERRLRGR
jgi:hypothetical protein